MQEGEGHAGVVSLLYCNARCYVVVSHRWRGSVACLLAFSVLHGLCIVLGTAKQVTLAAAKTRKSNVKFCT